jgi:catechol 2,3-dioxygenase-like lactoylglutathione lyase family enzyme
MLMGAHVLLYSEHPEMDRAFFRDVLGLSFVDSGGGWLIFKLPVSEAGIHPIENGNTRPTVHAGHALLSGVLYLMCDDLPAYVNELKKKGAACSEVETERWGIRTTIKLPSGSELGVYQPTHETALNLE